jgi:hypothetical protein
MTLTLVEHQAAERAETEALISQTFQRVYRAQLSHFLPHLLRLDQAGQIGAVAGVRAAQYGSLFLEQYLDKPVEQSVATVFRTPVDRDQVVEIGNLTSALQGFASSMFVVLAAVLYRAGYRWVVCTVTPKVAVALSSIGYASRVICRADPARLQSGSGDWGNYYASRPQVIVGDVASAARSLESDPGAMYLIRQLAGSIDQIAASL